MKKKFLYLILRLTISFGLIAYFLYTLAGKHGGLSKALKQFIYSFAGASYIWLIPALFMHLIGFALVSLRWRVLLKAQGVDTTYRRLFSYYIMASFFNTFLPSTIGGDTVRALEGKKLTGSATSSIMVVIVERLTGLIALVFIATVGLTLKISESAQSPLKVWFFLLIVIVVFIITIVLAHPRVAPHILDLLGKFLPVKIHDFLKKAYEAVSVYYRYPRSLLTAISISIVFQLNMVLYYFVVATALHQNPDIIEFLMMVPIMIFLLMIVPAINGLGIRTAGFTELMNFSAAFALAMEFIDLAFRIGYGLIGGLLFMFYRKKQ